MENKNIVIFGGLGLLALVLIVGRKKADNSNGFAIDPLPTKPLGGQVVVSVPEANQPSNPTSGTNTGGSSGTKPKPSQGTSGGAFSAKIEVDTLLSWLKPVVNLTNNNDNAAFLKILSYSDSQLKLVDSAWRQRFGKTYPYGVSPTLRKQVESEFVAFYRTETVNNKKKVIDRLTKLGL